MDRRHLLLLVLIPLLFGSTILVDRLFYDLLIFKPVNRTGWESYRWYNFDYNLRRTAGEWRRFQGERTLVVGSSIAKYAVQEQILSPLLQESRGEPVSVKMAVHASMLPSDLKQYASRLVSLGPDTVLYLTNPADLDLERYLPPWEAGPRYSRISEEAYIASRIPGKLWYPEKLALGGGDLTLEKRSSFLIRGLFRVVSWQDYWIDPLLFSYRAARGDVKRYLYYQGVHTPEGVWKSGWAGGCFTLTLSEEDKNQGVLLEFPAAIAGNPESSLRLYRDGKGIPPGEEERFWEPGEGSSITINTINSLLRERKGRAEQGCSPPAGSEPLDEIRPGKGGWSRYRVAGEVGEKIYFQSSHVVGEMGDLIPFQNGEPPYLGRSVRIPGQRGVVRVDDYLVRRAYFEDTRLIPMSEREYLEDFRERIEPVNWRSPDHRALHQFNHLRLSKYYLNWIPFRAEELTQLQELKAFADSLPEGVKFVIVNIPENPWTLATYGGSDWYRGYLSWMERFAAESGGKIRFIDLHDRGRMQEYADAHHLTYDGMLRFAPILVESLNRSGEGQ